MTTDVQHIQCPAASQVFGIRPVTVDNEDLPGDKRRPSQGSLFASLFSSERTCAAEKSIPELRSARMEKSAISGEDGVAKAPVHSLFSSNGLWEFRDNILSGISSRFEALQCNDATTNVCTSRKVLKDRSVFGQPEVHREILPSSRSRVSKTLSRDSLDTVDSGHSSSMESSRHSASELNSLEMHDSLRGYRASATESVGIGSSLESSETEEGEETGCSRSASRESLASNSSYESCEDKLSKEFMQAFVNKVFEGAGSEISAEEKALFGTRARADATSRLYFARYICMQRGRNQKVTERTFYCLVQYFAIVLFECAEADDFTPAKTLMNMCFTYFHQTGPDKPKQYLYQYLKEQTIWRSLRFWNAAFFDAVLCERANMESPNSRILTNITFGQLGTFTHNMKEFGLSKQLCLEFLRKQSVIGNLPPEQIKLLRDNIENMYNPEMV